MTQPLAATAPAADSPAADDAPADPPAAAGGVARGPSSLTASLPSSLWPPSPSPSPRPSSSAPAAGADPPGAVDWVRRAQAGDRQAFEQLVRGTARMLYARLYLETGDRDRADDLVQETYLTAWRAIGQLRDASDAGAFRRWLFAVARTARLDATRRDRRRKRGGPAAAARRRWGTAAAGDGDDADDPLEGVGDPSPPPDELLDRRERQERALALLRTLPEEYRLPIAMRYLGGAEHETICRQLGLTSGSLRGLLTRGMHRLRQLFAASEA